MPLLFYLNFSSTHLVASPFGTLGSLLPSVKAQNFPGSGRAPFLLMHLHQPEYTECMLAAGQGLSKNSVATYTYFFCTYRAHSGLLSSGGAFSEHSPSRFSVILPISSFVTLWLQLKH